MSACARSMGVMKITAIQTPIDASRKMDRLLTIRAHRLLLVANSEATTNAARERLQTSR